MKTILVKALYFWTFALAQAITSTTKISTVTYQLSASVSLNLDRTRHVEVMISDLVSQIGVSFILFGGEINGTAANNAVTKITPTNDWTTVTNPSFTSQTISTTGNPPVLLDTASFSFTAADGRSLIFVDGGVFADGTPNLNTYVLDMSLLTWNLVTWNNQSPNPSLTDPATQRAGQRAAMVNNKVIMYGGAISQIIYMDFTQVVSSLNYNLVPLNYLALDINNPNPQRRSNHQMIQYSKYNFLIYGGHDPLLAGVSIQNSFSDAWILNVQTCVDNGGVCSNVITTPLTLTSGKFIALDSARVAATIDGQIIIQGGLQRTAGVVKAVSDLVTAKTIVSDLFLLNPSNGVLLNPTCKTSPNYRASHSFALLKNNVIASFGDASGFALKSNNPTSAFIGKLSAYFSATSTTKLNNNF